MTPAEQVHEWMLQIIDGVHPNFEVHSDEELLGETELTMTFGRTFRLKTNHAMYRLEWTCVWDHTDYPHVPRVVFKPAKMIFKPVDGTTLTIKTDADSVYDVE